MNSPSVRKAALGGVWVIIIVQRVNSPSVRKAALGGVWVIIIVQRVNPPSIRKAVNLHKGFIFLKLILEKNGILRYNPLMYLQRTINQRAKVSGIGLHSGDPTTLTFCPASTNTGIRFVRTDLPHCPMVEATAHNVQATSRATTLGCKEFEVSTVEHCLSALAAIHVDNLLIELDGPEIPIIDGSSQSFLTALLKAEVVEQDQPRSYVYITRPIFLGDEEKYVYVLPYNGLRLTCTIDFSHPSIGKQQIDLDINEYSYSKELATARTFGFYKDLEPLQTVGLAKGASLDNTIGLSEEGIMNKEGLRFDNEFVRHKALDALGDLVTLGSPMMGHLVCYRAGHDLMNGLVKKILASKGSYQYLELGASVPETIEDHFEVSTNI